MATGRVTATGRSTARPLPGTFRWMTLTTG